MLNWQIALLVIGILVLVAAIVIPVLYVTNVLPTSTMFTIVSAKNSDTNEDVSSLNEILGLYVNTDEKPSWLTTSSSSSEIISIWQSQSCNDDGGSCYYWVLEQTTSGSQFVYLYNSTGGTVAFYSGTDSTSQSMGVILNTISLTTTYGYIQMTTI